MMNTITCKTCGTEIEIDKALEGQIEAKVLAAEHHKHQEEIAKIRTEQTEALAREKANLSKAADKQLDEQKELLKKQAEADLEFEKKKIAQESANETRRLNAEQEHLIKTLRDDAETEKEQSNKLREQLSELMKTLREEKEARVNAQLVADKKLAANEDKIREDTLRAADEKYHLKLAEQAKQLLDTQNALEEARRKASQGSQQNQGEVLELDLENRLREEFPFDEIVEIKKGQRGADLKQIVKNHAMTDCGVLLWETKNGKWQPAWIAKFKQDIREATANIGVIVSQEIPTEFGDMKNLDNNIWVVSPRLAPVLAVALRLTILQVDAANKMNAGKDQNMETLYQFLVGPEFRHRVEAIVENYSALQKEIELEKRTSVLRWSRQEKAIRAVIDNTIGMYGDLQGITNKALPAIKMLGLPEAENLEEIEISTSAESPIS